MDSGFQFMFLGRIHPVVALVVGVLIIALPYLIARGVANRILAARSR